jgi:hypothetical protein
VDSPIDSSAEELQQRNTRIINYQSNTLQSRSPSPQRQVPTGEPPLDNQPQDEQQTMTLTTNHQPYQTINLQPSTLQVQQLPPKRNVHWGDPPLDNQPQDKQQRTTPTPNHQPYIPNIKPSTKHSSGPTAAPQAKGTLEGTTTRQPAARQTAENDTHVKSPGYII